MRTVIIQSKLVLSLIPVLPVMLSPFTLSYYFYIFFLFFMWSTLYCICSGLKWLLCLKVALDEAFIVSLKQCF